MILSRSLLPCGLAVFVSAFAPLHVAEAQIYVSSLGVINSAGAQVPAVAVYPLNAGNIATSPAISGSNTGLNQPQGIAVNAHNIFVTNDSSNSVTIYALDASGNATPTATISGSNTGLNQPQGIATNASNIFVVNPPSNSVTIYTLNASGNATPTATISGSNTGLNLPWGIAVNASNIFVTNHTGSSVTIYPLNASGNVKPTATISGSNTGLSAPLGVAVGAGNIFVINNSVNFGASVTIYPLNASGNATPTATISGSNTGLSAPFGVAVGAGNIFVVNQPSNSVIIYPLNATGNATPTASINCISGADGIAIRSASHFSVTVSGAFMVGRPALAAACTPFNLTVTALDSSNNTVTSYHGKVTFATTAHDYALPPNSMLTNGVGTFSATLNTPGIQTLTATDTMNPSITGTSSNISVSAGAAKRFSVTGPTWVTPGQQFSFTVTALDCSNNIATSYSGTARFKSGDIKAVFVPRASTLKNGVGTFSATLITPGVQAVNATDTVARAITGTLGIHVQ